METTQSGAEQHCKPQMELSQKRRQQTSLPEFLKKRAQLHPQLIESKMSGPRHGLCSKTQLLLALTHVWLNAWPSESLKKRWKRWNRRRLQDLMESQMKCWNISALGQSVPTAHLQPKLVDRYCTNNLEGSCHKTHSKKGKRQVGSVQLSPDQSAQLCWRGSSTKGSYGILSQTQFWLQHKQAIDNFEAPKTNWLSWRRTSKMPSKRRRFWQFSLTCQRPSTKFGKRGYC